MKGICYWHPPFKRKWSPAMQFAWCGGPLEPEMVESPGLCMWEVPLRRGAISVQSHLTGERLARSITATLCAFWTSKQFLNLISLWPGSNWLGGRNGDNVQDHSPVLQHFVQPTCRCSAVILSGASPRAVLDLGQNGSSLGSFYFFRVKASWGVSFFQL